MYINIQPEVEIFRYSLETSTLGLMYVLGQFCCYTLEDEVRNGYKIPGMTAIPEGTYPLKLQQWGRLHSIYEIRYPDTHKGMITLCNVPDFTGVMIHEGNRHHQTEGCILVGDSAMQNITDEGSVGYSRQAYQRIYPLIALPLDNGEQWSIAIKSVY